MDSFHNIIAGPSLHSCFSLVLYLPSCVVFFFHFRSAVVAPFRVMANTVAWRQICGVNLQIYGILRWICSPVAQSRFVAARLLSSVLGVEF
ncbi:unnamed protein product [Arabidopsis halleri]